MNFSATNATLRQLLANGLAYRVPPSQRDYSWGDDEWDDLWQDIVALFEADSEPAHYIWDEAKIESRQRQLAKIAASVWRIKFGV